MNRLIIIGNGFDRAHGLATRYCDFICDFWTNLNSNFDDNLVKKIVMVDENFLRIFDFDKIDSFKSFKSSLTRYCNQYGVLLNENLTAKFSGGFNEGQTIFNFENELFRIICERDLVENWVDIENVYYEILKEKGLSEVDAFKSQKINYPNSINKLNEELEEIKDLLEIYLTKNIKDKFSFKIDLNNEILNLFRPVPIYPETQDYEDFINQFPSSKHQFVKKYLKIFDVERRINQMDYFRGNGYSDEVLILDFNYTPTSIAYFDKMYNFFVNASVIKIHGELNSSDNPINFGFGDEYDDDYKSIENINKNEYLKNIKSFKYSNNTNYRKLMNFVFEKEFQIYILGHSCGLSDRTLLQSIFEHENCLSIKPIYYIDSNGKDNYSDMVYNISRNFKNKIMMRDKIVDKSLTKTLNQKVRFKGK